MQRYNNLTECIQMCDRILQTNTYPRNDLPKGDGNRGPGFNPSEKFASASCLVNANAFYPSRTIVIQNFLSEAEAYVRSFVATFGIVEICEIFKENVPSCFAVVQYKFKSSAIDALLLMSFCQVRGSNLVVNFLWNAPYENIENITRRVNKSFKECMEKRIVCIGQLPRSITEDAIRWKCNTFGLVESVQVQPQDQGASAYVVFQNPLSAAVATYCLRNSTTSNAALMLGYSENGSPVLLGPIRVRPLDHYYVPLTAFDVRCIWTRFLDYSRIRSAFINIQRTFSAHHIFRPGCVDHCVRIPTCQVRGISLYIEVILLEDNALKSDENINEMAYQLYDRKYLYRFSVDFGLHKPVMSHDEKIPRPHPHYLRWNSFFILDLQICFPWGQREPRLEPRVQGMNHVYSDINSNAFDEDAATSTWFGVALRYSIHNQTPFGCSGNDSQHSNKVRYLLSANLAFVRLVGSCGEVNGFQIPIHVFSDS